MTSAAFNHILDLIQSNAETSPHQTAVSIIIDGSGNKIDIDWLTLTTDIARATGCYRAKGLKPGDRVMIMLPTSKAFLAALLGAMGCGLTPVAVTSFDEFSSFYKNNEWQSLIASLSPSALICGEVATEIDLLTITPEDLASGAIDRIEIDPSVPCYLQLSSGSTGIPKGIVLSWPAVRANLIAIAERIPLTTEDHMFSWLPMHHDMGLFGTLFSPLFAGSRVTLMDPRLFVTNPMLWLRSVAAVEATITTTPPSALHFCLKVLRRRPITGLDLSKLEKVICGSEPVTGSLIRDFNMALQGYGVGPAVLKPVYGLAENTLAVSIPHLHQLPRIERIDKQLMEQQGIVCNTTSETHGESIEQVCVGSPLSGVKVAIRDNSGADLCENRIGDIWLNTPSLLSGILEKSGSITPHQGWFDTGDTGYISQGEIFITGRRRDIIIKNGRNYSPERLEELAIIPEKSQRAVAFGLYQEAIQSERVVILIEVRKSNLQDPLQRDEIRLAVRSGLKEASYPVDEIKLVEKGSLPRTSSGKIRRQACRLEYLEGKF